MEFAANNARSVLIRGEGIAASCCARLLSRAGVHVSVQSLNRPKLPAILIGETTQKLLTDVFERDDLFAGMPHISRRVVAWGRTPPPIALAHSALVVSEEVLLNRIRHGLAKSETSDEEPGWTIFASTPLRPGSLEHRFGSRMATASPVKLKPDSDSESCWIESLESGWLFLLPTGGGLGWLLSVGEPAAVLLSSSRLIEGQILELGAPRGTFPCHPRIVQPLAERGWIACGTAAVGFDPLCGDGTGNAIREAILGSAVIGAAFERSDVDQLVAHYCARVVAGFRRHLALCLDFYTGGHSGPWWDDQLHELKRGLEWCSQVSGPITGIRYRLNGFMLEPVD